MEENEEEEDEEEGRKEWYKEGEGEGEEKEEGGERGVKRPGEESVWLDKLWTYSCEQTEGRNVSSIAWNSANEVSELGTALVVD